MLILFKKNYYFLISILIILIVYISEVESTKMLLNSRNNYRSCDSENSCEECMEDGYFKSCSMGLCYCCNMDSKCKNQK